MINLPRRSLFGLLLLPGSAPTKLFSERGAAVRGTDVVAYFTEGRPLRGRPEYAMEWSGARWLFTDGANLDRFRADPAAHAPAYGGFCAWAVAHGYTASTDPEAWRIVGGRLYLNHDRGIQRRWERDIPGLLARADAASPRLRDA